MPDFKFGDVARLTFDGCYSVDRNGNSEHHSAWIVRQPSFIGAGETVPIENRTVDVLGELDCSGYSVALRGHAHNGDVVKIWVSEDLLEALSPLEQLALAAVDSVN